MKYLSKFDNFINEAYLYSYVVSSIFKKLKIDLSTLEKLGEGDNGVAYRHGDKTIKITTDTLEAEFFGVIKGHKLEKVSNCYEVYEYDCEEGEDNKKYSGFCSRARYYWVIIKDYIPYQFSGDYLYGDCLRYFDSYVEKNFNFTSEEFDKMIDEYRSNRIEDMKDDPDYDVDEDYELENELDWFIFFKELHMELQPLGIKSVCDMKSSNMGRKEDGGVVFLELHIFRDGGYKEPVFTKL